MNAPRTLAAALIASGALFAFAPVAMADDDGPEIDATQLPVTQQQAVDIALAAVPGTVTGTELDDEDGTALWEVEIVDGSGAEIDVEIDANTAEILQQEADQDDEEDDDDRDDENEDGNESAEDAQETTGN